jgi:hypothetical protein
MFFNKIIRRKRESINLYLVFFKERRKKKEGEGEKRSRK